MKFYLLIALAIISCGCFLYGFIPFLMNDFSFTEASSSPAFMICGFLLIWVFILAIIRERKKKE